jgi:hypothetical protein
MRKSIVAVASIVGLLANTGVAAAAPPASITTSIKVEVAGGFRGVTEKLLPNGRVIDTFKSADATVRVFGRVGSSVSFFSDPTVKGGGGLSVDMTNNQPKGPKEDQADNTGNVGAVAALIALGVDPAVALRDFGGLDTMDGSTPASDVALVDQSLGQLASTDPSFGRQPAIIPAVSSTVPWDTQCITIDAIGSRIQGRGCSTIYLIQSNGAGDWHLTSKWKLSAQSTSTSLFPLRLQQVGWALSWAANNLLTDWDPSSTRSIGSCSTVTVTSLGPLFNISVSGDICPNSLGPWGPLTDVRSGSKWQGSEQGTAFEAAIGTQEIHDPANASSSHSSTYFIEYNCGLDC